MKDKELIKKMIKSSEDIEKTVRESRNGFNKGVTRTLDDLEGNIL